MRFIDTELFPKVMAKIKVAMKGFKWCMVGGRSVEVWVNPPQTPDVDVLVEFKASDYRKMVEQCEAVGFKKIRGFFDKKYTPMIFFKDEELDVEFDVIGAFEDVHQWTIERSKKKKVNGITFPVALPEDIVILKANAALSPNRGEKAERDVAAILSIAKENDLDTDYMETILGMAMMDWSDESKLLKKLEVLR